MGPRIELSWHAHDVSKRKLLTPETGCLSGRAERQKPSDRAFTLILRQNAASWKASAMKLSKITERLEAGTAKAAESLK